MKKSKFTILLLAIMTFSFCAPENSKKESSFSFEKELASIEKLSQNKAYENAIARIDSLLEKNQQFTETQILVLNIKKGIALISTKEIEKASRVLSDYQNTFQSKQDTLNEEYCLILDGFALLEEKKSRYKTAKLFYNRALNIRKKIAGTKHLFYAKSLENLGSLNFKQGKYEQAEDLFLQVLTIRKKKLGENHADYANVLSNLAGVYYKQGKYEQAEPLFLETNEIEKKTLGAEHPEYATSLNNLASLYRKMGKYEQAVPIYLQAKEIRKKVFGKKHSKYANSLNSLGSVYFNMNQFEQAKQLYTEAANLRKELLGAEHPTYATTLYNLGRVYVKLEEYEQAKPLYEEALKIGTKSLGTEHPNYAIFLNNLGLLHLKMGDSKQAENLLLEAKKIRKNVLGEEHLSYANSLGDLGEMYLDLEKYEQATPLLLQEKQIRKSLLTRLFNSLSEKEKANYQQRIIGEFNAIKTLALVAPKPALNTALYNLSLFEKGLKLNTSIQTRQYIFSKENAQVEQQYQTLTQYYQLLSKEYEKPIGKRKKLDSLELKIETIEKSLARASSQFRMEQERNKIEVHDIRSGLTKDEIAIEFTHFNYLGTDSIIYAASVVDPNNDSIQFIPLFSESDLENIGLKNKMTRGKIKRLYSQTPQIASSHKSLYDLVWKPLEKVLKDKKRIYYSSSGLLHRLNLNAFPINENEVMSNRYEMYNLLSTKSILSTETVHQNKNALTFGDVNYDWSDNTTWLASAETTTEHSTIFSDYANRSLTGESWSPLAASHEEVLAINEYLEKAAYQVNYFSKDEATEEIFKMFGIKKISPTIIHLATHGFFFPDVQKTSTSENLIFKMADHPMLRSGIILAHANHIWKGNKPIEGKEDGILTAYEISHLNLSNTNLVVLSACKTGLGDIQGNEGVYGLQRAFKKAGVKHLIMSLWEVPDLETAEFMKTFYQNWLAKEMSIRKAFNRTQLAMKNKYRNPTKWAGFVLIE